MLVATVSRAKTEEPIEILYGGVQSHASPRNHVLDAVHMGAAWQLRWIDKCGGGGDADCLDHYCSDLLLLLLLTDSSVPIGDVKSPS